MIQQREIIKATINRIENAGAKFSMLDIAKDLRTSKRTLYKYFNSKEELVAEAINYVFEDIERQHLDILKLDISCIEKLKKILMVYPTNINMNNIQINKIIESNPDVGKLLDNQFSIKWDLTLNVFDECVKNGEINNFSREAFRSTMLGIYETVIVYPNHQQLMEECVKMVFNGLENKN